MGAGRIVIAGGGIGGLAAAVLLAAAGEAVTLCERRPAAGGKMRQVMAGGRPVDSGPTVFTMRWVFEALFDAAGATFASAVPHAPLPVLARHFWDETPFDLFAERARSAAAVAALAGGDEARRYIAFCDEAERIYTTLKHSYLTAPRPNPVSLAARVGLARLPELLALRPFETMWAALGRHFRDPRLRQLFGRYATYCGSSPFAAPATLMLIAHVEAEGVWSVSGGMQTLAEALVALARRHGADIRLDAGVRTIEVAGGRAAGVALADGSALAADAVVVNADAAALAAGLFGDAVRRAAPALPRAQRSLSAVTWSMLAETSGFPLSRHTVFFGGDSPAEFADLFGARRLPRDPTVYVCAQDRDDSTPFRGGPERALLLINAPADGDAGGPTEAELAACETAMHTRLTRSGLTLTPLDQTRTGPATFAELFPGTGGALYGRATHGWQASFLRPAAQTRLPGLYLAGGSAHPGAGVPMAALSGILAADAVLRARASTRRFHPAAMFGGTRTR